MGVDDETHNIYLDPDSLTRSGQQRFDNGIRQLQAGMVYAAHQQWQ